MEFAAQVLNKYIFRKDKIVELCRGKSVLHLGFIQHSNLYQKKIDENDWLHSQIAAVAKRIVGIDYLFSDVQKIKTKYGYEVYPGDVTQLDKLELVSTFEIVVCGEIIEHLENPGLMLEGIKRFMTSDSLLILTSPNPWSSEIMSLLKKGVPENKWLNPEHTMWFSAQTLQQILDRTGYDTITRDYYYGQSRNIFLNKTTSGIIGFFRLLKRLIWLLSTPKNQFNGLFFVGKLRPTKNTSVCNG